MVDNNKPISFVVKICIVLLAIVFITAFAGNDNTEFEEHEEVYPAVEVYEGEDPYENEHIEQAIIALPEKRYELNTDEFYLVCGIVMAEAGGEPYEGMMAVAQSILANCERNGCRPFDVARMYATPADTWTDEVWLAVTAVFFEGQTVFDEPPYWFYAPALCTSDWHESQKFIGEIGGHRFFTTHE